MRTVKFEQLKRRCLHDFMRKKKKEILDNKPREDNEQAVENSLIIVGEEGAPKDVGSYYQFGFEGIGNVWV